jgi:hypothetical protein
MIHEHTCWVSAVTVAHTHIAHIAHTAHTTHVGEEDPVALLDVRPEDYIVCKRHIYCILVCKYVKKTVLELGFIWVWVLGTCVLEQIVHAHVV